MTSLDKVNLLNTFEMSQSQVGVEKAKMLSKSIKKSDSESIEKDKSLQKIAQDFESIFLEIVLKSMRQTVDNSELLDGGNAEDIYRSMLDSEYAKIMAHQNQSKLSEAIVVQLNTIMGKKSAYFSK